MDKKNQPDHPTLAEAFNKNESRVNWHDETLWFVRKKRDVAAFAIPEWEQLRNVASAIKADVLDNLHHYLTMFERKAEDNFIEIHWAETAEQHNKIIHSLISKHNVNQIVKSKSMLTEECHLNEYLESKNIEVIDTDLGERIVQLAGEAPSHIVLPCIHWKKEEIGELFHKHLGTPEGNSDPQLLTSAAREHLREKFLTSKVAITGVNFAVAETGEFVVCTNEGNADLGAHLADVHIACMGIEKIIPTRKDLGVFLRLLARSATGQAITTYSSHFSRPRQGQEMHVIIVDNGRTERLHEPEFRNALKCIRCGACFNTCPVYRRSGGHSYHSAIAGPIGAILAPAWNRKEYSDLPFASTLCGSCSNVCPVKIDIHDQLYKWRQRLVTEGYVSISKKVGIGLMNNVLSSPGTFRMIGSIARKLLTSFPSLVKSVSNAWLKQRDLPPVPKSSFREWYKTNRGK
jgi:L-lactate dehydrogenase complex protein LldF